jgi:hypothetical protein
VPNLNRVFIAAMGVMLLALATGAAAADKKKAPVPKPLPTDRELGFYGATRDQLRATVKRVGLLPTRLPVWLDDRQDAEKSLQEMVTRYLTLAGFEVVGSDNYQAAYDRFNKQVGGIYDGKTGLLKDDVAGAVFSNALREFVKKERLDAYVIVRAVPASASYYGQYARWDGVHDRSDGKLPDIVARFLETPNSEGTVPALTLRIQIVSAQDRVLFGRDGGIELTAYFDGLTFVRVATKDLLRDSARIERATRIATLPLVRTPREIADGSDDPEINAQKMHLKNLPPQPPALKEARESPLLVPRDQILGSVKRIALSPIYPGPFKVPADVQKRLTDLVREELAPLGWEIVDSPQARELLLAKMMESQLFDPLTGKRDEARATEIRKSVFSSLGTDQPPDAILWLSLVRSSVLQKMGDVAWDGVEQNAFTRGPVVRKFWSGTAVVGAGTSSIAASSINMYMTDSNDTVLYQSRGGLEVLQSIKVTTNYGYYQSSSDADTVDLAPSELFRDPSREKMAVHAALRDLVLTPEALVAELNPNPKKGKKKEKT